LLIRRRGAGRRVVRPHAEDWLVANDRAENSDRHRYDVEDEHGHLQLCRCVLVILVMALAFFGKGIGALGWAVLSDACPKEIAGLSGGSFNMFGNISSITTLIGIGYIIQYTGSFNGALVFVVANALTAVVSYLVIIGEIRRLELRTA
jgi:hypothetical protein